MMGVATKVNFETVRTVFTDTLRGTRQGRALGALSEETLEGTITGASAIVIDSTSTDDERTEAINGFAEDIRNMSGERIIAVAVASD
jgi:hypothetical protein